MFKLIIALFFTLPAWAAEREQSESRGIPNLVVDQAISALSGAGSTSLTDSKNRLIRLFFPEDEPQLQILIEQIHSKLMATDLGRAICHNLMLAQGEVVERLLGVSRPTAQQIAAGCSADEDFESVSGVLAGSKKKYPIEKISLSPSQIRRLYTLIIADSVNLNFDSWTEPFSNRTVILVDSSLLQSPEKFLRFLTQTLAHELAIYLDAKSWPGGPGWKSIADLRNTSIGGVDEESLFTAIQNPYIAQTLSFIRAYKIERLLLQGLQLEANPKSPPQFYSILDFPFLRLSCKSECLESFILSQRPWLDTLIPTLNALNPVYRTRKSQEIQRASDAYPPEIFDDLNLVLGRLPVGYLQNSDISFPILHWLDQEKTTKEVSDQLTQWAFANFLLPGDMETVRRATVYSPRHKAKMDYLTFMSIPLLSGQNIQMASGPRPRIRTGVTR